MKKILITLAAVLTLASCTMDFYRSDKMTSTMFKSDPGAAVYSTDGNYAMFKDELDFGLTDRGGFTRIYYLMTELRGDNVTLSGRTSDPLYENNVYGDTDRKEDLDYMWSVCYKIIYGCNSNIESLPEGESASTDHLIGENYFLRAVCHFTLCDLFATPYSRGPEKPGVIIRNSTDCSVTERASVGDVYKQIESDLKDAERLMAAGTRRGNAGYASYDAARGLRTRLYLYMGEEKRDECIQLCNDMIGADAASHLDTDIATYFARAKDSKETLWCIGRTPNDPDYVGSAKGQLSSMYYTSIEGDRGNGAEGWCEMYWSDPLIDLMRLHPEDKRLEYLVPYGLKNDGLKFVVWPVISDDNFRNPITVRDLAFDESAAENKFTYDKKEYTVKKTTVNGVPSYYIEGLYSDAEDKDDITGGTRCWVRDNIGITGLRSGYTNPMYGMTKFSFQDGETALSSPVYIRWAEVILNAAEAYAHKGDETNALKYVNAIRTRAGIPTWSSMQACRDAGYTDLLDVVLDERRLELCFEGHRAIDVYRNGKDLDRRFAGCHPYEVITPEQMDIRYPYCIPFSEISVSGISGNGRQ